MLRRIDPEHGMARYYSLMIERDLFGTVRYWGRIGALQGRELQLAKAKRRGRPRFGACDRAQQRLSTTRRDR